MILLYTDFGWQGPYVGQMESVLRQDAPDVPVVNLMADAPVYDARAAGHLLAALVAQMPADAVVVGVVDPGVGSSRDAVILEADGRRFVGPGNGLFDVVAARAAKARWQRITWRPERLSASFHGRDLFAPVAARLATGEAVAAETMKREIAGVGDDLAEIIYIDGFGNAMTGMRADRYGSDSTLLVGPHRIGWARTFSDVPEGTLFWYQNALGLVEIAANRASAAARLGCAPGTAVAVQ